MLIILEEISDCENEPESLTHDVRIEEIMNFIKNNYERQITLDKLSKQFFFNKYYLCRMFKEKTGFNISQYIEACRISAAISLLKEGVSVADVAVKVGYGSDTYFISKFKKNLGLSPKKYKKSIECGEQSSNVQ